jgi:hypothetical protein
LHPLRNICFLSRSGLGALIFSSCLDSSTRGVDWAGSYLFFYSFFGRVDINNYKFKMSVTAETETLKKFIRSSLNKHGEGNLEEHL